MQKSKRTSERLQRAGQRPALKRTKTNNTQSRKKLRQSVGSAGPAQGETCVAPVSATARFTVAPAAADLNPDDILLSARLRGALSQLRVRKLGDLHGLEVKEFLKCRNCGKRSLRELETVLRRAGAGEYALPQEPSVLEPSETLRALDESLASLPARNRDCLIKRFGGHSKELLTLDRIGRSYSLTRERVRQIINGSVTHLRLYLGPVGKLRIQHLLELCRKQVLPVTPELIEGWLPAPWPLSLRPAFYARLLAAIWPELPVLTGDEPSAPWIDARTEALLRAVRAAVEAGGGKLTLKEAFLRVSENPKYRELAPEAFLAALKDASQAGLRIHLDRPELPEVGLV
jgi:hypothetical protein